MARPTARRLWLLAHRWIGLSLGLLLLLAGLTGAALVVARPADEVVHEALYRAPAGSHGAVSLDTVRQRLSAEFPAGTGYTLRPPRLPGEALLVYVRGPWSGTLHLDPSTGAELGRRGEHEGVFNFLFELHATLLLEDTGRAVLASAVLAYLVLLLSGLVLWWPARWRHAFSVRWVAGLTRALFDLHRVAGALLGLGIAVSVLTGAYMAWRPLSGWVSAAAGATASAPPALAPTAAGTGLAPSLDAVVAEAARHFPGGQLGYVQWPARVGSPGRIRFRMPDDPHPNGLSSAWFDPRDGRLLALHPWRQLDPGARAYAWIYPLHIGRLGGPWHLVLNATFGLALAGLGVSGVWLWWRRRRARRGA